MKTISLAICGLITLGATASSVHAAPTVLAPSIFAAKSEQVVVARDAANCALWYGVPNQWEVQDNVVDSFLSVEGTGSGAAMVASLRYKPVRNGKDRAALKQEIFEYIERQSMIEDALAVQGKLPIEEAFYLKDCDAIDARTKIELRALPISKIHEIQLDDPQGRYSLRSRFVQTDYEVPDLVIDAREKLVQNGARLYRMLTQPKKGVLPLPIKIEADAIDFGTEGWLSVKASVLGIFQVDRLRETSCRTECSRFLFWGNCKTSCWTSREWINQYLKELDLSSNAEVYVLSRSGGLPASRAVEELLGRFLAQNFGDKISQMSKYVTQTTLGQEVKRLKESYVAGFRQLVPKKISFSAHAQVMFGLSENTRKPVEEFLKKEKRQ